MKTIVVTLASLLVLTSCRPEVKEGEVIGKEYEPERTWIQVMPMTIMVGKTAITQMIPMSLRDDEDFIIIVKGVNENGELVTVRMYADNQDDWDAVNIGDFYSKETVNGLSVTFDDPVFKQRKS